MRADLAAVALLVAIVWPLVVAGVIEALRIVTDRFSYRNKTTPCNHD